MLSRTSHRRSLIPTSALPRWLVIDGIVEAVLLATFFLVPFSHLWGQMPSPPLPTGPASGSTDAFAVASVALIFAIPSLVPFAWLVRIPCCDWPDQTPRLLTAGMLGLALLPALVALVTYPCCTSDVLDYVNRQRLWVVYGGNPFAVVPNDYPQDWSYSFANFKDSVFGYGPVWWLIGRLFTQWATTLDGYLLGFKLLALVCFGVSVGLIWSMSDVRRRLGNLLFFAWNPVVLIDGVLRLHNDLLTVPWVLGAVWLLNRRQPVGAMLAGTAGALIKVTAAPVELILLVVLLRERRWRTLALGAAACLVLVALLYAPFWFGPSTFAALIVQANRPQWSFGAALVYALGPGLLPVIRLLLAGVGASIIAALLARDTEQRLADTAALVMLVALLCLPLAFYSHYLMPVIALAAVGADARVRRLVLAVAFGTLINAVLGVDSLAGGLSDGALDVTGSCVLMLAVVAGLLRARAAAPRSAPAT